MEVPSPSYCEEKSFIETLQMLLPSSSILNVTTLKIGPKTNHSVARNVPLTISSLYSPHYSTLGEAELHTKCDQVFKQLSISTDEADYLSKATILQSESSLWFEHRKGRITASQFGAVCWTSLDSPSKSLLERILQKTPIVSAPALKWGRDNEQKAREAYTSICKVHHSGFTVTATGLHIHPDYPHLGASPDDGLVSCSCCGEGVLEIKCPFSKRNIDPSQIRDCDFYLKPTATGLKLSKTHNYYMQVQGQLAICKRKYCDFVCWTPLGMHIERIESDPSCFQCMVPKLQQFFVQCVLPVVLRGSLSDQGTSQDNKENESNSVKPPAKKRKTVPVYCFCRKKEFGRMIACDNPTCPYEWFHFSCVNITEEPKGDWFCSECAM